MNYNNVNPATGLPGHQVLSLDKNCLTCSSGGIPFAMSAFKIACLSYTPSVIKYEKGTLSRKHLIDIKGSLLDLCADNLNNFDTTVIDNAMRKLLFYVNSQKEMSNSKKNTTMSPFKYTSPNKTTQNSMSMTQFGNFNFEMIPSLHGSGEFQNGDLGTKLRELRARDKNVSVTIGD
jgi:hypothetical protein